MSQTLASICISACRPACLPAFGLPPHQPTRFGPSSKPKACSGVSIYQLVAVLVWAFSWLMPLSYQSQAITPSLSRPNRLDWLTG